MISERVQSEMRKAPYSPMVRTMLDTRRLLFIDSLSCGVIISSYFARVGLLFPEPFETLKSSRID
jgi:hypothetical protein